MSLGLQCFLLLVTANSLLALPLRTRREDNFEASLERSSRDATEISMSEDSDLFEGDIKLSGPNPYESVVKRDIGGSGDKESIASTKVEKDSAVVEAYKSRTDLWEGGKVYYKFDTILTPMYRSLYKDAMKWWTDATTHNGVSCITFVEATNKEKDYLLLRKVEYEGCSSYIGRQGGEQFVNISSTCSSVGSAAHELGHALGLWHEQSRPDRDMYINVLHDNIISQEIADKNFGILSESTFSKVPPVSYDIGSIMHYGKQAFTKDQSLNTIEVREDAVWDMCDDPIQMGQRTKISHKDALRVKLLYGCGDVTPADMPESCGQPTPTPTLAPTLLPVPTPTKTRKIETNDTITLQFADNKFGVQCKSSAVGCSPIPCTTFGGLGQCSTIENRFQIIKPGDTRIGHDDKVLLRSVNKKGMWLNCSGINKECTISECTSNAADSNSSSYISDCEDHFFIIKGVNRSPGKVLSTKHKIQFKSYRSNTYMNCIEKKCRMIEDGACPNVKDLTNLIDPDTGKCNIQHFNIAKY